MHLAHSPKLLNVFNRALVFFSVCPYSFPVYNSSQCQIYTHPFNGPLSGTTQVSRYQKGKINLDFIGARDSE